MRILLLCLFLAGCQTFAPEPPPQPRLPETYRTSAGDSELRDAWWLGLHSPQLDAIMHEALRQAPGIRAARARLEQARAAAAKTGSALWPELDAQGSASATLNKPRAHNVVRTDEFGLGLAASYEVDLWGRVRALRTAGDREAMASEEDVRAAVLTLSGEIAESWISLCSARRQLATLKAQQQANADLLSSLELRFANSLASALDVLQQREAIAQNETLIAPLQAEAVRLENRLNALAGKAPGTLSLDPEAQLPQAMPLPATGIPADLLEARPDIRADLHRLTEAGWSLAAAEADRMPALRLTGAFEHSGDEVRRVFDNWLANLAASLTAPLLDGGYRRAEVRRQQGIRDERLAQYEQTVFEALAEVDTAVSDVRRQEELLAAQDAQYEAVRAAFGSAMVRYRNGVVEYDTVLSLLLKLQQLERTRIQGQANLLILQTGLCRALGMGWRDAFPAASPIAEAQKP